MTTTRKDISKNVGFAILDMKTMKLNDEINKLRKAGNRIHVTMSGYLDALDYSRFDGVSIEQGVEVIRCTFKPVAIRKVQS